MFTLDGTDRPVAAGDVALVRLEGKLGVPVVVQIADTGRHFSRDALAIDPTPPDAALIVLLGTHHPTALSRTRLENFIAAHVMPLRDVVSVLVREERIVPVRSESPAERSAGDVAAS